MKSNLQFLLFAVIGVLLWLLTSAYVGDQYAVAVGPDAIVKVPLKGVYVAAWLITYWVVMRLRFPTVYDFCRKGHKSSSTFTNVWKDNPNDPRLWISVVTHLGVLIAVALVMLAI